MPALDDVTQTFTADVGPYVAALQVAIDETKRFADAVKEAGGAAGMFGADTKIATSMLEAMEAAEVLLIGTSNLLAGALDELGNAVDSLEQQEIIAVASNQALNLILREVRDASADLMMQTQLLADGFDSLNAKLDSLIAHAAASTAAVRDLGNSFTALAAKIALATAAAGAGGGAGGGGGGGFGIFGAGFWGASIGGIAAWHIALDLAIEAIISFGTAIVAAGLGVAALYPVFNDMYDHFSSVYDVTQALGIQVDSLGGAFARLTKAVAPQGIELLGGALQLVSGQTGLLSTAAEHVVTMFDDWMAHIDLWSQSQGTFSALLHTGAGYLQQFANILGTLGSAIGNLLRDDPGIARFLLDIVDGAAKLLNAFTNLPGPIVEAALALHGLYLWGSVLGAAALRWAQGIYKFGASLVALSQNPLTWLVVAAAGLAYFGFEATQAQSSVKNFIATMNSGLANASASTAILQIGTDLGELNTQINQVNWRSIESGMNLYHQVALNIGYVTDKIGEGMKLLATPGGWSTVSAGLSDLGEAFGVVALGTNNAFRAQAQNNLKAYNAEINTLLGSQRNLFHETGDLMSQGYSYAQSLGIMDLAGVKANDTFEIMHQKVQNLIAGYNKMSVQGGILSNSVNAINLATDIGDSKITALTGAWTTFFNLVGSGENGLISFEQAMGTTGANATGLAGALQTLNGPLTGLSTNSLAAQQAFMSAASAAQTELNNITQMVSVAGLGAKGTDMITQSAKDMITQLLPAARSSSTLTTVLYALAQQGGYLGKDTLPALTAWLGKVANPASNLQGIIGDLTADVGNLNTDLKNLSTALGTTLTQAASQAIFYADGGQKAFDNFATALATTGINSSQTRQMAIPLAAELISVTGNANLAHQEFDAMAGAMGYSKSQADTLWGEVVKLAGAMAKIPSNIHTNITVTATGNGLGLLGSLAGYTSGAAGGGSSYTVTAGGSYGRGGFHGGIAGYASGGIAGGMMGYDAIPAWLTKGEGILTNAAVSALGGPLAIRALNDAPGRVLGGGGGGGGTSLGLNLVIQNKMDGQTVNTNQRQATLIYNRRNPQNNLGLRTR